MGLEKLTIKQLSYQLTPSQLIGVLSTLVSLLVGAFFLGSYLAGVRYENQVNEKEKLIQRYSSQWAAIEPHLRMEKFFDISDHIISVDSREAPPNSVLVNKEFLASITIPGLTYSQTTVGDYRGLLVTEGMSTACWSIMNDLAPVHLWKGSQVYALKNNRVYKHLFSHIMVQRISKIRLQNKLLELFQCWHENEKSNFRIGEEGAKRLSEVTNSLDQLDIVGLFYTLLQFQNFIQTAFDPDFGWPNTRVQKNKQTLVASNFLTYKNVKVIGDYGNDLTYPEMYIRDQIIMVEVPRYIYFVNIIAPSVQITRDAKFDDLTNQWLAGVRFFYD